MKKSLLALLILGISFTTNGQKLMTIGEVFNYEIGDEFQITGTADNQPPNADRIKIVGKYYSPNSDTLFYIRYHDSYYTEVIWDNNPYLEYHFWTITDTVFYTNLDSSLVYYDQGFEQEQYIKNSPELCDSLINGCSYDIGPGYENDHYTNEYGKGLGQTYAYYYNYQAHAISWMNTLFYYKKGDNECGVPDSTTVGINEETMINQKFSIYPNPVKTTLTVENNSQSALYEYKLMDLTGKIIIKSKFRGKQNKINIEYLRSGLYFLYIYTKEHAVINKFVKE